MTSIAGKMGCAAQAANDRDRLKLLEREVKELLAIAPSSYYEHAARLADPGVRGRVLTP